MEPGLSLTADQQILYHPNHCSVGVTSTDKTFLPPFTLAHLSEWITAQLSLCFLLQLSKTNLSIIHDGAIWSCVSWLIRSSILFRSALQLFIMDSSFFRWHVSEIEFCQARLFHRMKSTSIEYGTPKAPPGNIWDFWVWNTRSSRKYFLLNASSNAYQAVLCEKCPYKTVKSAQQVSFLDTISLPLFCQAWRLRSAIRDHHSATFLSRPFVLSASCLHWLSTPNWQCHQPQIDSEIYSGHTIMPPFYPDRGKLHFVAWNNVNKGGRQWTLPHSCLAFMRWNRTLNADSLSGRPIAEQRYKIGFTEVNGLSVLGSTHFILYLFSCFASEC